MESLATRKEKVLSMNFVCSTFIHTKFKYLQIKVLSFSVKS